MATGPTAALSILVQDILRFAECLPKRALGMIDLAFSFKRCIARNFADAFPDLLECSLDDVLVQFATLLEHLARELPRLGIAMKPVFAFWSLSTLIWISTILGLLCRSKAEPDAKEASSFDHPQQHQKDHRTESGMDN